MKIGKTMSKVSSLVHGEESVKNVKCLVFDINTTANELNPLAGIFFQLAGSLQTKKDRENKKQKVNLLTTSFSFVHAPVFFFFSAERKNKNGKGY